MSLATLRCGFSREFIAGPARGGRQSRSNARSTLPSGRVSAGPAARSRRRTPMTTIQPQPAIVANRHPTPTMGSNCTSTRTRLVSTNAARIPTSPTRIGAMMDRGGRVTSQTRDVPASTVPRLGAAVSLAHSARALDCCVSISSRRSVLSRAGQSVQSAFRGRYHMVRSHASAKGWRTPGGSRH